MRFLPRENSIFGHEKIRILKEEGKIQGFFLVVVTFTFCCRKFIVRFNRKLRWFEVRKVRNSKFRQEFAFSLRFTLKISYHNKQIWSNLIVSLRDFELCARIWFKFVEFPLSANSSLHSSSSSFVGDLISICICNSNSNSNRTMIWRPTHNANARFAKQISMRAELYRNRTLLACLSKQTAACNFDLSWERKLKDAKKRICIANLHVRTFELSKFWNRNFVPSKQTTTRNKIINLRLE